MDESTLRSIAAQLRKPEGEYAIQVGERMNEGNRDINLYTIEALELKAGDKILEIGMGNGFFVKDILSVDESITYAGCDYSAIMVEEANKINEGFVANKRAAFYVADAGKLPFADNSFDKTFTINTIYFWDEPATVLAELRRVLMPGGQLIVAIRPKHTMVDLPFTQYGFTLYTKDELQALLLANGFKVIDTIERIEPAAEMSGEKFPMEGLLVIAQKA